MKDYKLEGKDFSWHDYAFGCEFTCGSHCSFRYDDGYGKCHCGTEYDPVIIKAPDLMRLFPKEDFDVWDRYCIDRILTKYKTSFPESYDLETVWCYYGAEIGSITLRDARVIDDKIDFVLHSDREAKLEFVLAEEYKSEHLFEVLKGKTYGFTTVTKRSLVLPDKRVCRKIFNSSGSEYGDGDLPKAVVINQTDSYLVLDGYRRIASSDDPVSVIVATNKE